MWPSKRLADWAGVQYTPHQELSPLASPKCPKKDIPKTLQLPSISSAAGEHDMD